jgi:hypothetical protein
VISRDGLILTQLPDGIPRPSRGGVAQPLRFSARFDDGSKIQVATVFEGGWNLAILKPTSPIQAEHLVPLVVSDVQQGQTFYLMSLNDTRERSVDDANVEVIMPARKVAGFDRPLIQLQSKSDVEHGGAPLLNRKGEFVGMNVIINDPPGGGRVFAMSTSQLIEMCKAAGFDLLNVVAEPSEARSDVRE